MVADSNSNSFEIGFVDGPHLAHHDDLFVRVGVERLVCDSYYFEVWQHEDQYSGLNAYRVLAAAIDNWIRIATAAVSPACLYVPFGLNDEYVNWITIEPKSNDDVVIGLGWNRESGYAIDPIDGIRIAAPPNLHRTSEMGVRISRDTFFATLMRFRTCIDREFKELQTRTNRENSDSHGSSLPS